MATKIFEFSLNGVTQAPQFQNRKIYLDGLTVGINTIEILYENEFSRDGTGIHRYVDKEDGKVYLYTKFEPFFAHHCFPCFDQPDLKAKMKLFVLAPTKWKLVSNEDIEATSKLGGSIEPIYTFSSPTSDMTLTEFTETPRISTYLFALVAGPFVKVSRT
jgi:aminopeptidase N